MQFALQMGVVSPTRSNGGADLTLGPSSSGSGFSLYTGNFDSILEYSGFTETVEPPQPGGEPQSLTDSQGNYFFTSVVTTNLRVNSFTLEFNPADGKYVVCEVLPTNYRQTSPGTARDFYYG